ncbi:MAG: S9 family peptidase, partial [Bacteroidales bacterium]|nr:S9 family peptidase [Candidatus Colimorpha onthohippi]
MAQYKPYSIEDFTQNRLFRIGSAPRGIPMNDGLHYALKEASGIVLYNYTTGQASDTICRFKEFPDAPVFKTMQFDSEQKQILLSANTQYIYRRSHVDDYYLYNIERHTLQKITTNGRVSLTQFSPNGKMISYVRNNNLYYIDIETFTEHAVTTDGKHNYIINGSTDWVYEEEFSITQGACWSPDSKRLAFMRFDESRVKEYTLQRWGDYGDKGAYPTAYTYKYPKVGEDNSIVEIRLFDIASQQTQTPELGSQNDQYLPRFQWIDNNQLAVMRMNRLQNHLELIAVDATTLQTNVFYEETDSCYVEVPSDWIILNDHQHFIINSERNGFNHLYMCSILDKTVVPITVGDYEITSIYKVDQKHRKIYFGARQSSPLNIEIFSINFDGSHLQKLSEETGYNHALFSANCKYYVCTHSTINTPPVYTIRDSKGKLIRTINANTELLNTINEHGANRKEFGQLTTAEGTTLNYYIIKPANFDSTKQYPLLIFVYGGPGDQQVTNEYRNTANHYWLHYLAQQGYAVACFDGRGTGGRGAQFKKCTYKNLGHYECEDALHAARYFGSIDWIDHNRIGIFGWSFGGYLSSLAMFKGDGIFKTAVAVAPVTTWRYYDNIYTERYLQRPQDNPNGYDQNAPITYAHMLKGNYLLIHGTDDDNVHLQNSLDLISELHKHKKQFQFHLYPNQNHSIPNFQTHLYT